MPAMQPPEGSPQEEQGESPAAEGQEGGDKNPLMGLQQALTQVGSALIQDQKVPPEAKSHLKMSISEYNQFLTIMQKSMGMEGPGAPSMGNQSSEAAGNPGAVPAGQPMGKNVRPMQG